jgi:hypothetical protein
MSQMLVRLQLPAFTTSSPSEIQARPRIGLDRAGEGLSALVWIIAFEPGHHRAAAAQTLVCGRPVPLTTSQTSPWTSDGCVGEKRIFRLPSGQRNVVVIVAPVLPPLGLPPGQDADSLALPTGS